MSAVRIMELATVAEEDLRGLLERRIRDDPDILGTCREIIAQVRRDGDRALVELTHRFDGVELPASRLRVGADEIERAEQSLAPAVKDAFDYALENIRRFHELQRPSPQTLVEIDSGIWCGERWTAVESVCLYVPRGRGAFGSVACMLCVPARLAGVGRVVLCTPPGLDGEVDAATLYVAKRTGVEEVYRVGGAQAVSAVAFGTETVPVCDKIVGPGNAWVSTARQLLSRVIEPGPPAGPSESLIVSDGSADPENVAWNLMIEAEHGENSCALLVTHLRDEAESVAAAVSRLVRELTPLRRGYVEEVLGRRGGVMLTDGVEESCRFANRFAAEHVALMVADPWTWLPHLRHAGEILLGNLAIFSLANYAMGINAILPTGGRARSASGVSVLDFMKRTSLGFVTDTGYRRLREIVPVLSRDEGFSAHHLAVQNWKAAETSRE